MSPFKSKAQMGWMFANHPEMAKEWAGKTGDVKDLPEHVAHAVKGGYKAQAAADKVHHPYGKKGRSGG